MLAIEWLANARSIMQKIEDTQLENIKAAATVMADRGVKLYIHPSHNVPGDTTAHERLDACLAEYKRRVASI